VGLGDEMMVTGLAREAQARDPRKVRIQYEKGKRRWCPLWDNNPRIAKHEEQGDFQVLEPRTDYIRPYCSSKTDRQWTWKPYQPPPGEVYFAHWETAFGNLNPNLIVIGPALKIGASPNKQWGHDRWAALTRLLTGTGKMVQMGTTHPQNSLPAVAFLQTEVRQAAAVIARARLVICSEGALHHIAAAVGTPAVVIYGGYISPKVTGYEGQVALFRGGDGLGCGMRVDCTHCATAMASITPEEVADAALGAMR